MDVLSTIMEGESIFYPNDETIDKKCYELNDITNWGKFFYGSRKGILLEKYIQLMSKTDYKNFFEGLNYEYGLNNISIDLNKAFNIYKNSADNNSIDSLSCFRLYRIYKNEFNKFDINKRNFVLEKYYLLKSFAYLSEDDFVGKKINIEGELSIQLKDAKGNICDWYKKLMNLLKKNYSMYHINKNELDYIRNKIDFSFKLKLFDDYKSELSLLRFKDNLEAAYEYLDLKHDSYQIKDLEDKNYYRGYLINAKYCINKKDVFSMLKKSIAHGYYFHIKYYIYAFLSCNKLSDIIKTPELKLGLKYIIGALIDNIIVEDIYSFYYYIRMRNILIKYFNYKDEFFFNFDVYTEEIAKFLLKFGINNDEKNLKKIKLYYFDERYKFDIYAALAFLYYYGIRGILDKNYKESLRYFNYCLKEDKYNKKFFLTYIYFIKRRLKKDKKYLLKNKNKKTNNDMNEEEEELINIEKELLNLYLAQLSNEKLKSLSPSFFYFLSKIYNSNSINNRDMALEYVFLNMAANTSLTFNDAYELDYFFETFCIDKAKKKIQDININKDFKKIFEEKGAINIAGYGEDGSICPICLDKKKTTICIPCKHFFCSRCIDKCIDKLNKQKCPLCRIEVKAIFDMKSKKEKLMNSNNFFHLDDY